MTDELDEADEPLFPVAGRIADGLPVDWDEERERAALTDRAVVDALRDIATIEAAHRDAQESLESAPEPGPARWRHLTILETIGEGHFGSVMRAFDNSLQVEVALKLSSLNPAVPFDASEALREARLLAKVHHANVVRVHGADHCDGRAGIWMDLVRGQTLEHMLHNQRFGAAEASNVGVQLCRALAAVHDAGVLHGDIKPHNVIRRDNGDFVLVDFGASTSLTADAQPPRDLVGTLVYVAPEVLAGAPRSCSSDVYALGVLLFKLVSDTYPLFATSVPAALEAHRSGARKHLRDLRPDLPGAFVDAVERATAPDPSVRFQSAGALEAALQDALGRGVPPPPPRVRWFMLLIGAATLAALGAWVMTARRPPVQIADVVASPTLDTAPPPASLAPPQDSFTIDASFFRVTGAGDERLDTSKAFRLDDAFYLSARVSAPTYLYVVDEDDAGKAFLLFPLPGDPRTNPLPANQDLKVPEAFNWKIDSAGGREHLLLFASRSPLGPLEDAFRLLPSPTVGGPASESAPLPPTVLQQLRSAGRLTAVAPRQTFWQSFQTPLRGRETTTGLWARQLTIENRGSGSGR